MQKLSKLATVLIFGALMSATVMAAGPATGKAFVKVNGVAVSQDLAEVFVNEQKAQGAVDSPELRNAVREELIGRELLIQAAKKAGIDKKPDIVAQADAARQAYFVRAYVQDFVKKNPVTDDQLKADYEKIKSQMGTTEYKSRHILVKTEEEAVAIIANLKKGAKFEELAKQSLDPGSKDNGGVLDWSSPSNFVKPFSDALVSLSKGKYTETPVKSEFGYHVILLDDSRPLNVPKFEDVKPRLLQQAQSQQINKMVADLRAKAKIE